MKNLKTILSVLFLALSVNSCIDRDILEEKVGVILPTVTDLKYTIQNGEDITLHWSIPSVIPSEMQRPLSVYIQVFRGTTLEYQISLPNEPTTWNFKVVNPENDHRIVVKLQGSLKEKGYGMSDDIYSLGQTVAVKF